jgi:hypothetical protein
MGISLGFVILKMRVSLVRNGVSGFDSCATSVAHKCLVRLSATLRAGVLPARGWGRIDLAASQPRAGTEWTDDGASREELANGLV